MRAVALAPLSLLRHGAHFRRGFRAAVAGWVAIVALASPLAAQLAPQGEVAGFAIVRAEQSGVCFAVREGDSAQGARMIFTTYHTPAGQRWQVAGYVDPANLPDDAVVVSLSVDGGEPIISRRTEVRDGDFMFPFESLPEVEAYEAAIADGTTLSVRLNDGADTLEIPLEALRAALAAVGQCLSQSR